MTLVRHLHLVRHAESPWNVEQRYQGHGDSGLTAVGIEQAERLADWLVEHVGTTTLVLSSDLARAEATAAAYAARSGADVSRDARFREVDIGVWSGRSFAEIAAEEPDLIAALATGDDLPRGGGETFAIARLRVAAALGELAGDGVGGGALANDAVVFTHGGPIRVAVAEAIGLPAPGHSCLRPPTNCSITTFELVDGCWHLLRYNCPTVVAVAAEPTE